MKSAFLVDSHILLWLNSEPRRLSKPALKTLDLAKVVYFSAASVWELVLKRTLGKLNWTGSIADFAADANFQELPITSRHAEAAAELPLHHRDPFDRMLIAQAQLEDLCLLTADRQMVRYPVEIMLVPGL